MAVTAEHQRLEKHRHKSANWKNWGPYLSERAWGTVREDYSPNGEAWDYLTFEKSHLHAYRWNEDGLGGISDRGQYLCFALALWNGKDPYLKERLFGLSGREGNHGEDVKEYYFYLDSTPTHSYMKMLYKYPLGEFPYAKLVEENRKRTYQDPEYELLDTGIFDEDHYMDVFVEYAKADENDILIKICVVNRSDKSADCHLLPTLWFRNTWSWGYPKGPLGDVDGKPSLKKDENATGVSAIEAQHPTLGTYFLYLENQPELLFTENESNFHALYGIDNHSPYVKDAFQRYLINGEKSAVNPAQQGTKSCGWYPLNIPAHQSAEIKLRLCTGKNLEPFATFEDIFKQRKADAEEFYKAVQNPKLTSEEKKVQRQAMAGMLWSKQFYYYDLEQWLKGDAAMPSPPNSRMHGRNHDWEHFVSYDILSMPDKWEYPWFASWDLAFHCITLALVDPDFSKRQLVLMTREWYMHPNGQLPSYEWGFGDVNPPVHAWAVYRVFKIDAKISGAPDYEFLQSVFNKLLLNFTWWVNRKDVDGNNIFQGGFLGMDNISLFDRSMPLPTGGRLDQADATAWMGFYCIVMIKIALELSKKDRIYQDMATKFFEHFLRIAQAMTNCGGQGYSLWDSEDEFFYDALHLPDDRIIPLKVRSMVGLLPLLAVETIDPEILSEMPDFKRRLYWFADKHSNVNCNFACLYHPGVEDRRLIAILTKEKMEKVLKRMFDENEFLSEYGIRSISKHYQNNPYHFQAGGREYCIKYQPAESDSGFFGGNSNWRGPIWFPVNFLLIESLQKFHHYYGDEYKVEFPTGSGNKLTLWEISQELSKRLTRLFLKDASGKRPIYGNQNKFQSDPLWGDNLLFFEYFNGDNGAGLGASHQTGWTGLVAKLLQQCG